MSCLNKQTLSHCKSEENSSDDKELEKCDIKFSMNLENISKQFSLPVLKALKHLQGMKIEKEVTFFVPRQFRTSHDANKDKITKLSTELEDWVEDYLGFLLVSGYGEKVVQREISQVFWLCPFYSVDSIEFKILCCFAIVGAILNDWVASSNTQNANCRMDVVEYLTNLLDTGKAGSPDLNTIVNTSKSSTLEMMNKAPIVAALYDGLMDIYEMTKNVQPDLSRKTCFTAFRLIAVRCFQGFQWAQSKIGEKTEDLNDYSVETSRYFRQLESPLEGYCAMVGLLEGYELPSEIKTHAVFFKWNDLATKISVIQNDVLGFSVDVKNGKENGIIMQSMRNGCSVRGAVDEEIKLLSEFASDYVKLRHSLLTRFSENTKFQRYIDIVDSWLYGNIQAFIGSRTFDTGSITIFHR